MWILFVIIIVIIVANYFLGARLYMEPKNKEFFHNVKNVNTIKMPEIAPDPQYVMKITCCMGCLLGLLWAFMNERGLNSIYSMMLSLLLGILYWIEISRRVSLTEDSIILSKALSKPKKISLENMKGIYIYSFGKKFMKRHDFTTKLVIATEEERTKFTISSLNKKAILNMIKNNFGVTDYKIFVATNR